jgi:ribosomal protein L24E
MAILYRAAITVTRRQPYFDWANSFDDDGPKLTEELRDRRTVYLVAEPEDDELDATEILDDYWEQILEEELGAWMESEDDWPAPRTREMFDECFGAEVSDTVIDLDPDDVLTETDAEFADLATAFHTCGWCGVNLEKTEGHYTGFPLADRESFASREGLVFPVAVDEERVVMGMVTPRNSDEARAGDDLIFRVCSSRCEKAIRRKVPKALRRMSEGV